MRRLHLLKPREFLGQSAAACSKCGTMLIPPFDVLGRGNFPAATSNELTWDRAGWNCENVNPPPGKAVKLAEGGAH